MVGTLRFRCRGHGFDAARCSPPKKTPRFTNNKHCSAQQLRRIVSSQKLLKGYKSGSHGPDLGSGDIFVMALRRAGLERVRRREDTITRRESEGTIGRQCENQQEWLWNVLGEAED